MNPIPEWKIKRIKKMCSEGVKQTDVAKALNISQWTVSKHDPRKLERAFRTLERVLCQESTL